jgi:hypothetical protein
MVKFCKGCNIPKIVSRDQVWQPNGSIIAKKVPTFRVVGLEVDHFVNLYKNLEDIFGETIPTCFTQGTRKNARIYIDGLLRGPLGYIARSWIGSKKVYDAMTETCLGLGYGLPIVTEYERKRNLVVEITDTVYPPHFLGDLRGAFEATERVPSKGYWVQISKNKVRFIIKATDKDDPLEDKFNFYEKEQEDLGEEMETCNFCGLPKGLTRFQWDEGTYRIYDTIMEERIMFVGFNDVIAIMHELEELVGDLIRGHVRDITVPYGRAIGKNLKEKAFEYFEKDLRLKGTGIGTFEQKGDLVRWEIHNPFYTPFLEGKLTGMYEAVMGHRPEVELSKKRNVLTLEMD